MRILREVKTGMMGLAVGLLMASSASALQLTVDRIAGYYSGNGGEFTVGGTGYESAYSPLARIPSVDPRGFQTFCLELSETISLGLLYNYTLEDVARLGGGGLNPDPLSIGTATLYSRFAQGVLGGYNYTPLASRPGSAARLQEAFWYLEDELSLTAAQIIANPFLVSVGGAAGKATASSAQLNSLGVHVLNPTRISDGTPRQSLLVYVPVPDGGLSAGLLGLSLLGLNRLRRRFSAN